MSFKDLHSLVTKSIINQISEINVFTKKTPTFSIDDIRTKSIKISLSNVISKDRIRRAVTLKNHIIYKNHLFSIDLTESLILLYTAFFNSKEGHRP